MTRLREAVPGWRTAAAGSLVWAAIMAGSAWFGLHTLDWATNADIQRVVLVYALGGLAAFAPALWLARFLAGKRGGEVRLAAALLAYASCTVVITSLIFAMDYRDYYAQWHDDDLSVRLMLEVAFTTAAALYQFAVLGLRLFFPIGFAALLAVALWFARASH